MPDQADVQAALTPILDPSEVVEDVIVCQVKRGQKAELSDAGRTFAASSAISLTAAALGASTGVLMVKVPAAVWIVITNTRVLMLPREGIHNTVRSIGNLTFAAPRASLIATHKGGLMNTVAIDDRGDGKTLLTLRFGVRKAAATTVAASCTAS